MTAHLDSMATAILDCLRRHPGATVAELAAASGLQHAAIRQTLYRYEAKGNVDSDKTVDGIRYWLVRPRSSPAAMVILDAVRRRPLTRAELRDITRLSRTSVSQALTAMEKQGHIQVISTSRPFRYALTPTSSTGNHHAQEAEDAAV